nr:endoglucanase [Cellvibrio japonicus]
MQALCPGGGLAAIRAIDPDNLIIVRHPTWCAGMWIVAANDRDDRLPQNDCLYPAILMPAPGQYLRTRPRQPLTAGIASLSRVGSVMQAMVLWQQRDQGWVSFMKTNHISNANWRSMIRSRPSRWFPAPVPTAAWVNSQPHLRRPGQEHYQRLAQLQHEQQQLGRVEPNPVSSSSQAPVVSSSSSTASSVVSSAVSGRASANVVRHRVLPAVQYHHQWLGLGEQCAVCIARATCSGQQPPGDCRWQYQQPGHGQRPLQLLQPGFQLALQQLFQRSKLKCAQFRRQQQWQ